jgi:membrane fusion protein, copper/silver efflux system
MKRPLTIIGICLILAAGAYLIIPKFIHHQEGTSSAKSDASRPPQTGEESYYTCPMHPSVRQKTPGACPVCGMTLVKKVQERAEEDAQTHNLKSVTLSPSRRMLANVATSHAEYRGLTKELRVLGTVGYAEPNLRKISIRFPGRIERLFVTFTGQKVREGDPVAEVYSPEAISAQQEYLLAKDSYYSVMNEAELISAGAQLLLQQSREKLVRWGFTESQLSQLAESREVQRTITIYSPIGGTVTKKNVDPQHYAAAGEDLFEVADLSTVWINADVYEYELGIVRVGQKLSATTDAYPGKIFSGKVTFVSPSVEPSTRTIRVRAELANPTNELKTDMFVNVTMSATIPPGIVIPQTALVSLGKRNIVWVEKESGRFEPREVQPGVQAGGFVQILEGIEKGEIVVTSGGFLLDSESQLETGSEHNQ